MQKYGWQGWALLVVRVGMGLFFLNEAFTQLRKGWVSGEGLMNFLRDRIDNGSVPSFYQPFIEDVVISNDQLFTVLVLLGEVGVGLALVLGLLTRATALTGIVMNANFLVINDKTIGAAGIDALFVIGQAALFVLAARQALSADEKLIERGVTLPLGPKRMEPE